MTTQTEVLKLALEAFVALQSHGDIAVLVTPEREFNFAQISKQLRKAIAEAEKQEQDGNVCARCGGLVFDPVIKQKQGEPVAQVNKDPDTGKLYVQWTMPWSLLADGTKFYTAPPQRKPLTDEQAMDAYCETPPFGTYKEAFIAGIRFIEAAHGIKE